MRLALRHRPVVAPTVRALALALLLAFAGAARVIAQDASAGFDVVAARAQLQDLEQRIAQARSADALPPLKSEAQDLGAAADKAAAAGAASLADVDARLAQLGPAPAPPAPGTAKSQAPPEDPTITHLRRTLQAQHDGIDADVKRAKLVSVGAAQAVDDVAERQRDLFNARLFQHGASPLTPAFWSGLAQSLPPDLQRMAQAGREAVAVARRAPEPHAAITLAGGLAAAILLLWPLRLLAGRVARRRVIADIPPSPLRRSAFALGGLLIDALLPLAAAGALALAARWSGALSPKAAALSDSLVLAVGWGALVAATGRALLQADAPSWRIAPLTDASARRLQPMPYVVAVVTMAGLLLISLNRIVGASLAATIAAHCVTGVVYAGLAAAVLVRLGWIRSRREAEEDEAAARKAGAAAAPERRPSSGWSLVALAMAVAIVTALAATLSGYAVFGALVAGQIYWLGLLAALSYLLLTFIDDLCAAAFAPHGWGERPLAVVFGLRRTTIDQLGVLTSAVLRLLILLTALTLALKPFGRGAQDTLGDALAAGRGLRIGTLTVSPAAILGGLVSLVVGLALVRGVRRWLDKRYLPATEWDAGVRNSVSTAVGYLGMALAVLWALASAGLGLDKVALIASALSVGIGFGLQQIVQNFVSGLILLAERPVKVGDWVSVGGVEGDVRHIRVRATEIQMFDRSTLLVPNSELVTKVVQNKTLHGPDGRVELLLSIGDPTRAAEAREVILAACEADGDVLCDPEPKVFIEGVAAGAVNLKCFAYVPSPRDAYAARSRLYFAVLAAFAGRGVALGGASQSLVLEPGEGLRQVLEARVAAPPSAPPSAPVLDPTPPPAAAPAQKRSASRRDVPPADVPA